MIDVLGWVAAAIGISAGIPQMVRILRAGSSAGISLRLWQITTATTAAWGVHGYLVGAVQMQIPNVLGVVMGSIILVFVLRDRRLALLPRLVFPLALAMALVAVDVFLGALVFGMIVAVPQLVGQLSQLKEVATAPDVTGVSAGFLAAFVTGQALWFVFGLVWGDWALIVCAGAMIVVASLNLGICLVRQAKARRVVLAV